MNTQPRNKLSGAERWTLLRDIGVFQVKLVVDGMRDLVLVPLSLFAGVISLLSSADSDNRLKFYHLLGFGKQTERWINLFGAAENSPEKFAQAEPFADASIDELLGKIEAFVVDEARRGGVTAQARERLNKFLDAVRRKKKAS